MKNKISCLLVFFLIIGGCKNGEKSGAASGATFSEVVAGSNQKTWRATDETTSQGNNDKLSHSEKKEYITFFNNGNMVMGGEGVERKGTWKNEGSTLSLQFSGEGVSENFTILEWNTKSLKLRAADGSELTMKPD
ncbi:MAG: lipocalin family protein [Chitinophagales bacterium]|nr:lipocalin family protein [Chitinophagales bacterium]